MRYSPARLILGILIVALLAPSFARAEVIKVTIASRAVVANGQPFGSVGSYEKLTGTIEFALDPANPHNKPIADLGTATRDSDGRVHFTADLYVLQPVDAARGNGTLLFEIANRGRKGILGRFNRAGGSQDPTAAADFGDGLLMKDGYTVVWVGWQFDVEPPMLRVAAPAANVTGRVRFSFIPDERRTDITPADLPNYPPATTNDPAATLTVRDRNWDKPTVVPRAMWRFADGTGRPRIVLDGGFEPGRVYEVDYPATGARVAGVGLAAIRDAASAFLHGTDMPVRGRSAYVFGISQSGRFLRQFLHDGFNADERDRRVFDLVWPHIAGAGQGSFNERFATPGYSSFLGCAICARCPPVPDGILRMPPRAAACVLAAREAAAWSAARGVIPSRRSAPILCSDVLSAALRFRPSSLVPHQLPPAPAGFLSIGIEDRFTCPVQIVFITLI